MSAPRKIQIINVVEKQIKNLKTHGKAAGPDNIKPIVLIEQTSEIAPILNIIYNFSIMIEQNVRPMGV